jgi:hypothetical protein
LLAKFLFAQLDANGFEFIDELEQLLLPADELSASLSTATIVFGQVAHRLDMFSCRCDILRPALSAIGEHGALVKFAACAMAGGFAALAAKDVEGARQDRLALETFLEQAWQKLLGLEKLGAKGTEKLVHAWRPGGAAGVLYITIVFNLQNWKWFRGNLEKDKKSEKQQESQIEANATS